MSLFRFTDNRRNPNEMMLKNYELTSKSFMDSQSHQNMQVYQFNDHNETPDMNYDLASEYNETINSSQFLDRQELIPKINNISSVVVPTLSNADEIFKLLSQKIAKYCQVLADLTNCEVFYKAQLPLNGESVTENNVDSKILRAKTKANKYRSLYWGTHQMLFQYSHNEGLKFDKTNGDSLIKINQRSLTNNVNNLIEEILNEPFINFKQQFKHKLTKNKTVLNDDDDDDDDGDDENDDDDIDGNDQIENVSDLESSEIYRVSQNLREESNQDIEIKDCVININRLKDSVFSKYFKKFENSINKINSTDDRHKYENHLDLPDDYELYSDQVSINKLNKNKKSKVLLKSLFIDGYNNFDSVHTELDDEIEDEDDDDADLDEKALVEKNCFNSNQNEDENYSCESCENVHFKHLTQLKVHDLITHQRIEIPETCEHFKCPKCNIDFPGNRIEFLKHLLLCYYPDIYSCKTCKLSFPNYPQFLFHTKYIHTNIVYMCSVCGRKYREIKDLLDHDQLMHSKNYIYCEICFEQLKSKKCLLLHYKQNHLRRTDSSQEIYETINHSRMKSSEKSEKIPVKQILDQNDTEFQGSKINDSNLENLKKSINDELKDLENKTHNINNNISKINRIQKNDLIRGLIDRKHQCKWCSLRFYTKSQLKQHEPSHRNSVLICPVCDKEFTHKDRLSGHMKCHMEPSLECKICGKKFKRLCNLYNHELVHGLTEHAFMLCQFCGRGFRSRRDYQNHVIANHRDQLIKSNTFSNEMEKNDDSIDSFKPNSRESKSQNLTTLLKNDLNQNAINADKTATVILSNNYVHIAQGNDFLNRNEKIHVDNDTNESEMYFTRTDTVQIANDNLELVNKIASELENNTNHYDLNCQFNTQMDSNGIKPSFKAFKPKAFFNKNKTKRLKSSLNVEVIEEDVRDSSCSSSFLSNH